MRCSGQLNVISTQMANTKFIIHIHGGTVWMQGKAAVRVHTMIQAARVSLRAMKLRPLVGARGPHRPPGDNQRPSPDRWTPNMHMPQRSNFPELQHIGNPSMLSGRWTSMVGKVLLLHASRARDCPCYAGTTKLAAFRFLHQWFDDFLSEIFTHMG